MIFQRNPILIIVFFLASYHTFAQSENKLSKTVGMVSVNYFQAVNFGNNALNKAYNFQHGVAIEINSKTYKKIFLGFGYNQSKYEVTNRELVGEFARANHVSFCVNAIVPIDVTKNLSISPQIAFGISYLNAKKTGTDIKNQNGLESKIGSKIVYELGNDYGILFTVHYAINKFSVVSNPEIKSFYNQSHSINFGLGFIFF
ncbi:MAG: hypothetical protein ACOVLC_01720 [Flavobacterium sp.]